MKRWQKLLLFGLLIVAIIAAVIFTCLALIKSEQASFNEVSTVQIIDQEAKTKYHEARKSTEEKAAKEADKKNAKKNQEEAAKKTAQESKSTQKTTNKTAKKNGKKVTYVVSVKGSPNSNLNEFRNLAADTLNDARGWVRAGVYFEEVSSGGDFTLWLSQRNMVAGFSPSICSNEWSCSVGRNVIINDMRWAGATPSWNNAKASLRDYRHMVVNHEVGHFLGHGHINNGCKAGSNTRAPIMQQQSMDLRNCLPNPWPLSSELWTNR
jgi:hypothetical protein